MVGIYYENECVYVGERFEGSRTVAFMIAEPREITDIEPVETKLYTNAKSIEKEYKCYSKEQMQMICDELHKEIKKDNKINILFVFTSIGLTNAATIMTLLLLKYRPDDIIGFGSVGLVKSPNCTLEITDVVEAKIFMEGDLVSGNIATDVAERRELPGINPTSLGREVDFQSFQETSSKIDFSSLGLRKVPCVDSNTFPVAQLDLRWFDFGEDLILSQEPAAALKALYLTLQWYLDIEQPNVFIFKYITNQMTKETLFNRNIDKRELLKIAAEEWIRNVDERALNSCQAAFKKYGLLIVDKIVEHTSKECDSLKFN